MSSDLFWYIHYVWNGMKSNKASKSVKIVLPSSSHVNCLYTLAPPNHVNCHYLRNIYKALLYLCLLPLKTVAFIHTKDIPFLCLLHFIYFSRVTTGIYFSRLSIKSFCELLVKGYIAIWKSNHGIRIEAQVMHNISYHCSNVSSNYNRKLYKKYAFLHTSRWTIIELLVWKYT